MSDVKQESLANAKVTYV